MLKANEKISIGDVLSSPSGITIGPVEDKKCMLVNKFKQVILQVEKAKGGAL